MNLTKTSACKYEEIKFLLRHTIKCYIFWILVFLPSCAQHEEYKKRNEANGIYSTYKVKTFTFNSPRWEGHKMYLKIPEITREVLNNDLILGYLNIGIFWYSSNGYNISGYFKSHPDIGLYTIENFTSDNTPNTSPLITYDAKILIIKAGKKKKSSSISPQQLILNELEEANVNIKDYKQVADYYNLKAPK